MAWNYPIRADGLILRISIVAFPPMARTTQHHQAALPRHWPPPNLNGPGPTGYCTSGQHTADPSYVISAAWRCLACFCFQVWSFTWVKNDAPFGSVLGWFLTPHTSYPVPHSRMPRQKVLAQDWGHQGVLVGDLTIPKASGAHDIFSGLHHLWTFKPIAWEIWEHVCGS